MVLLELVAERALTSVELCQWAAGEDKGQQAFRLADAALRGEMEGREETLAGTNTRCSLKCLGEKEDEEEGRC